MADRTPLASICRVIDELHDPHPTARSIDVLPATYNMDSDQADDSYGLIAWAVKARMITGRHARVLRRVVRTWKQQPAVARRLALATIDLLRVNRDI